MLGKLMKYEFRATGRVMLPLLAFLLLSAVGVNISVRLMENSEQGFINFFGGLLMVLFVLAIFALTLMSVVVMVQRFYKNLLTDEGYLMFTLPVSVHGLMWSKILVSAVWFVVTFAADMLAGFISIFKVEMINGLGQSFKNIFSDISAQYALNGAAFAVEFIIIVFLACAGMCLLFYASMSVGFSFPRNKWLLSVVFFFVFQIAMQFLGLGGIFTWASVGSVNQLSVLGAIHSSIWLLIAGELVLCAIFYVITWLMLKKRLNLE